jgi:hypothetical protein
MRPTGTGTSIQGIVGLPRGRSALLDWVRIRLASWLFLSFLKRDLGILGGQKMHRPSPIVTDGDRYVSQLFDYFESLDRSSLNLVEREAVNQ